MKIKIHHDVYDIAHRIQDIDADYFIVYDTHRRAFEVHNLGQMGSTYCLTLPYTELDERTLMYTQQTQSTNIDNIVSQLDKDNQLIDNALTRGVFCELNTHIEDKLKELL